MRFRSSAYLLFVLCLMFALFALPALALAQSAEVSGTVTAAADGHALQNVEVDAYKWDAVNREWDSYGDTDTDAAGHYSLTLDAGSYLLRAYDSTGIYDLMFSSEVALAADTSTKVDFKLVKDATGPITRGQYESDGYFFFAVPIDLLEWSWSSKAPFTGNVWAEDARLIVDPIHGERWYTRGSGIGSISYSVNGGAWNSIITTGSPAPTDASSSFFRIEKEGVNSVSHYAVDANGNQGPQKTDLVLIDKTPPSTGYSNDGKTITFKPADAISGVAATYYRLGTTGDFVYGSALALPASGSQVVQYYSVDFLGNAETPKSLTAFAPAKLTKPKASKSSVSSSKSFSVSGSVTGRSRAKGYVRIYKLSKGTYKYQSRKAFTEGSNGKFKVTLKLKKGTYKFKSQYGANTATSADMPIMSSFSSKVKVN